MNGDGSEVFDSFDCLVLENTTSQPAVGVTQCSLNYFQPTTADDREKRDSEKVAF
jgi:hypothetical protein